MPNTPLTQLMREPVCVATVCQLNKALEDFKPHVNFLGYRSIQGPGGQETVSLNALNRKISSLQPRDLMYISQEERVQCLQLREMIRSFNRVSDVAVSGSNGLTRLMIWIREMHFIYTPYSDPMETWFSATCAEFDRPNFMVRLATRIQEIFFALYPRLYLNSETFRSYRRTCVTPSIEHQNSSIDKLQSWFPPHSVYISFWGKRMVRIRNDVGLIKENLSLNSLAHAVLQEGHSRHMDKDFSTAERIKGCRAVENLRSLYQLTDREIDHSNFITRLMVSVREGRLLPFSLLHRLPSILAWINPRFHTDRKIGHLFQTYEMLSSYHTAWPCLTQEELASLLTRWKDTRISQPLNDWFQFVLVKCTGSINEGMLLGKLLKERFDNYLENVAVNGQKYPNENQEAVDLYLKNVHYQGTPVRLGEERSPLLEAIDSLRNYGWQPYTLLLPCEELFKEKCPDSLKKHFIELSIRKMGEKPLISFNLYSNLDGGANRPDHSFEFFL